MTVPHYQLQDLLLDMLCPARSPDASLVKFLGDSEWQSIMAMAREHRMEPLLHWRLEHEHSDLAIPGKIRHELANQYRESAIASLMLRSGLIQTHRLLEERNIPHLGLKGAYLAFFSYPHPALRPLRDLDILVPREQAIEAYETLIKGGLTHHEEFRGDPKAALEVKKHLPPLLIPDSSLWIELHSKLSDEEQDDLKQAELVIHDRWKRAVKCKIAQEEIAFLSPTDTLLHLIIHAVYDHKFSNGPLTISDLFYLIRNERIDWPLFWTCAEAQDVTRGCILALRMTEHFYGKMDIDWGKADSSSVDKVLQQASRLTLRDSAAQGFSNLKSARMGEETFRGKAGVYMNRLFPSKPVIASQYPVTVDSLRVYLWYPVWWAYVIKRVWQNLTRNNSTELGEESDNLLHLETWLNQKDA